MKLGSESSSEARRANSKGGTKSCRIEIVQDFISKNYSHARRSMEGSLIENKELMDTVPKKSKAHVALMADGVSIEENVIFFQLIPIESQVYSVTVQSAHTQMKTMLFMQYEWLKTLTIPII